MALGWAFETVPAGKGYAYDVAYQIGTSLKTVDYGLSGKLAYAVVSTQFRIIDFLFGD